MAFDYFYDGQIRRFLLQVVRAFSGFQYEISGKNGPELRQVPCHMATQNRQVGHILRNNSENAVNSAPMITAFIRDANINRSRTQAPSLDSSVHIHEREIDPDTNQYTGELGRRYTVERRMPHPLDLTIQVDLWTTNEHQKHQLFEQIYMAFNVGFSIQNSDNPIDWSSMTDFRLTDVQWSSRSVPVGTNDEIDVATFTFELPIWISPPAKVKQQNLIEQIVTNIYEGTGIDEDNDYPEGPQRGMIADGTLLGRNITTPDNAMIQIQGDRITLLGANGSEFKPDGSVYSWEEFLYQYGKLYPAKSQLRLRNNLEQDLVLDVVGTIQFTSEPNVLLWQVDLDTVPSNTLQPIKAIIDPLRNHPGNLPEAPADGHRYLILNDMGGSEAWDIPPVTTTPPGKPAPVFAHAGDIIEYRGGKWIVAFKSNEATDVQYLVNLKTGKQLKFDGEWIMSIDGEYAPGEWRLSL